MFSLYFEVGKQTKIVIQSINSDISPNVNIHCTLEDKFALFLCAYFRTWFVKTSTSRDSNMKSHTNRSNNTQHKANKQFLVIIFIQTNYPLHSQSTDDMRYRSTLDVWSRTKEHILKNDNSEIAYCSNPSSVISAIALYHIASAWPGGLVRWNGWLSDRNNCPSVLGTTRCTIATDRGANIRLDCTSIQ